MTKKSEQQWTYLTRLIYFLSKKTSRVNTLFEKLRIGKLDVERQIDQTNPHIWALSTPEIDSPLIFSRHPQFLTTFLAVTLHSPVSINSSLWAPSLPSPFWLDPSLTPTYKAFHCHRGLKPPDEALLPPWRPLRSGVWVVCAAAIITWQLRAKTR